LFVFSFFLFGCGDSHENSVSSSTVPVNVISEEEIKVDQNLDLRGIYHGLQPSYYLKNQYGDDMEVNGNKVPVPSIDFKFILKENNTVNLQQINLEDGSRVYYDGTFAVDKSNGLTKIVCNLNNGKSSHPTYNIIIDNSAMSIKCTGYNEPEFDLEKNDSETTTSSTTSSKDEEKNNVSSDGIFTYKDESVNIMITINGDSWIGKTTIITGMGDEYDKPEYESGIVKGQDLYEGSGMVKIGYVHGRNLITTIGDNQVTLSK